MNLFIKNLFSMLVRKIASMNTHPTLKYFDKCHYKEYREV